MGKLKKSMPFHTFSDSSSGSQNIVANGGNLTAQVQDNPVEITEKYNYPIRNPKPNAISDKDCDNIIYDILNTEMSYRKIAQKYDVNLSSIIQIKNGTWKKYRKNNLKYPLRPNHK